MASRGPSEACCTVPPAQADYKEKGAFFDMKDGMKCYTTGPLNASSAILYIYDIFGFKPQTLQGADILAYSDDEKHQYQVFMPDIFLGKPMPLDVFPPDTDEKKKQLGDFFAGPAKADTVAPKVPKWVQELTERSNGVIKTWAVLGACWGGKIVSLNSFSGTPFSVSAEVHPAFLDPEDAKSVTVPICILASGDEDKDDVAGFEKNLKVKKYVETFSDQVHGWMAARADLADPHIKKEYERGYKTLIEFYHDYL